MNLSMSKLGVTARRRTTIAIALFVGAAFLGVTAKANAETPVLTISPAVVSLKKGAKVTLAASGLKKGQEVGIRLVMGGVVSDIRHQVKPAPVANEFGAFYSEWVMDGEPNLLDQGAMSINIVDEDGKVLAHAPVVWLKEAKKKKEEKKEEKKSE